ncbi:DUF4241 domain-containing protein [Kitasatospora cheerisanensis]|uniref:DUF4241 domain-containing protein n=1 Tax=Kitasatospora cheerisanensis TaxID=81942 RepID=UPI001431FD06|nr:DUF4241 domain-containing protein [Kitasatospora cheerisanensis]
MSEAPQGRTAVAAVYGDGWDGATRTTVRPLSKADAARRDAAGEPYSVVFLPAGRSVPTAILHVARAEGYLEFQRLDAAGRRVLEADLRALESGRLFLRQLIEWRYEQETLPDRSDEAWRRTVDLYPDGRGGQAVHPRGTHGGSTHTAAELPGALRWLPAPEFDCWEPLLTAPQFGFQDGLAVVEEEHSPETPPSLAAAEPFGWCPPRPLDPPPIDELFTPGLRFTHPHRPGPLTVDPIRTVTEISLPDGILAICDPSYLPHDTDGDPMGLQLPPGVYPVQETGAEYHDEMFGRQFTARTRFAVRLLVSERPTTTWTMAVPAGEDARLLRDGHCYGFDVDSATGCFVEAAARTGLGQRLRHALTTGPETGAETGVQTGVRTFDGGYSRLTDDATGADLVAFALGGDGVYPVWVGRDSAGDITAVVVAEIYEIGCLEPLDRRPEHR